MRTLVRIAISSLLAACGAQHGLPNAPASAAAQRAQASSPYHVLTSFTKLDSGVHPDAGLTDVGDMLYGVTTGGGNAQCPPGPFCGTVFGVTTSGQEQVVYKFKGGTDGDRPMGKLLNVYGTLYGTTSRGGRGCKKLGCGTVFSVSTDGTRKIIYRFAGGTDGATPMAGLVYVRGTLYGTTSSGGLNECDNSSAGCGTVFSVTAGGKEVVLHKFTGGTDGATPVAGLLDVGGALYGTTSAGAAGYGTVYSITQSGSLKTLHRFRDSPDGAYPMAPLTPVAASVYGTTSAGGGFSKGTVFRISKAGVESVLYSFNASSSKGDGDDVDFPLIFSKGAFYVASQHGGEGNCFDQCGVLYNISLDGKTAKIVHEFDGGSDGCLPSSGLTALNGTLYGETTLGGSADKRCSNVGPGGTVYSYTP